MKFKDISAPIYSLIFLILSAGYFMTYVTVRMEADHQPEIIIGLMHTAFYAGLIISTLKVETLIQRVGHIRTFGAFASIMAATMLIQGLSLNPVLWIMMRFIAGVAMGGLYVSIESWLLAKSSLKTRATILGIYTIAIYGAQALSQWILKFVDIFSRESYLISGALCALAIVPLTLTKQPSPELHKVPKLKFLAYYKISPIGLIGCAVAGLLLSVLYGFVPYYAVNYKIDTSALTSLVILGGTLLQWPIGKLSDMTDRRRVLLGLCLASLLPCALIMAFPRLDWLVLLCGFFVGGCTFAVYPVSMAVLCDQVDQKGLLSATAVLLFMYSAGSVVGPFVLPYFIEAIGPKALFAYIFLLSLAFGIWIIVDLIRIRKLKTPEAEEFVLMNTPSPVGHELNPND